MDTYIIAIVIVYLVRGTNTEAVVNLQPDYMIKYELDQESRNITTDEETIAIGFSTQEKKGILMQIRNDDKIKPEYFTVEVNNGGGVKVEFDVGFERNIMNWNMQNVDLANNQPHQVVIRRLDKGRILTIAVDDYPIALNSWPLPESADTRLDNPKYIYFGRNESTHPGDGFNGSLFMSKYGDIYPLQHVCQDPRPSYITLQPEGIQEDMCGLEKEREEKSEEKEEEKE